MDIELGKEALKTGTNYVTNKIENVNVSISFLKSYFNIDDVYIFKKILLILYPFSKSQWDTDYQSRINKPDLYIPIMSLFTYILVRGMYYGLSNTFTPDKIGLLFTRLIFVEIIILLSIKMVAYFLNINLKIMDILCYSGYKYFTVLILQIFVKIRLLKWILSVYAYLSFFFFLSRSLKISFVDEFELSRNKKIYFIFGFVSVQILLMFLLS